jgi:hypothetical protein
MIGYLNMTIAKSFFPGHGIIIIIRIFTSRASSRLGLIPPLSALGHKNTIEKAFVRIVMAATTFRVVPVRHAWPSHVRLEKG